MIAAMAIIQGSESRQNFPDAARNEVEASLVSSIGRSSTPDFYGRRKHRPRRNRGGQQFYYYVLDSCSSTGNQDIVRASLSHR